MDSVLIRNGRIVTATDDYRADILVEDGRVRMIGRDIPVGGNVSVHDASGLLVLPGGVDVHTHLDWDFGNSRTVDTFGTGTRAAAFGGTTTLVDFANQTRGQSLRAGLDDWHRRAESACVDVAAHMIVLDVTAEALADMQALIKRVAGANGGMICVHAENGPVIQVLIEEAVARGQTDAKYHALTRPSLMEGEATHRAIRLAELAHTPLYVVHLSAAEALAAVTEARDRGLPAHAETCPHYLFLTEEAYDRPDFEGAKYVMTPPLRTRAHQEALWRGLRTDDLQVVSTDHCPFCFNEQPWGMRSSKQQGRRDFSKIPNGAPGVETRLPLIFDGGVRQHGLSPNRFVELTATTPAKLFGLFPRKGTIAVGSDADLVLFDAEEAWTIRGAEGHSRVDYTLFEGHRVTGRVKKVFLRGQVIVDGAQWLGKEGMGEFVRRGECGKA